jgi:quercetin dioxygenase-like cupin family protein
VAALVNISSALETTVDTFFQDRPFTERIEIVRAGEGREVKRTQQPDEGRLTYQYESLAYRLPGKHMEPFLVEFSLEADEPPRPMKHDGEEFLHIMEGEVEFISGDERVILHAGDSIYYYSSTPHYLRGIGTVTPRAVAVLYPYSNGHGGHDD